MAPNVETGNKAPKRIVGDKVLRFTKGERLSHWVHAVSFFVLLFTGLGVYSTFFQPAMAIFGGIHVAQVIHRIAAIFFVVVVGLLFFIGNPRFHWRWLKFTFNFTKSDLQHVSAFPKEFFGGHGNYPPQDKYNGGEKINSLITIFGTIFITLSGIVMWWAPHFPPGLVRWAYPVHDLSMFIMTAAALGHIYLSLLHPDSRVAMSGMLNGYVPAKFAQAHHAKWYERLKNEQQNL
ncbi:formate dehydrogenase subunit gamma [Desulfosporosinus youngiae]|uniref:Cytochrome b subunit of formate dehydrogenase n=1 Tax=Desulfosporosinus youngiae DSM 17734 TaxID=768710 RepID=H5XTM7_9FIRM|nr:cytochrome b/b6 domain-containing protein [Desulfosporosinus youngiae]EHQ88626.1 cytochrome b subunit of formate dehydrogenase [Desulfosporosinus youngiae DSM 17734]